MAFQHADEATFEKHDKSKGGQCKDYPCKIMQTPSKGSAVSPKPLLGSAKRGFAIYEETQGRSSG